MFCAAVDRLRNVWRGDPVVSLNIEYCLNQNLLYQRCCWTRDIIIHEVGTDSYFDINYMYLCLSSMYFIYALYGVNLRMKKKVNDLFIKHEQEINIAASTCSKPIVSFIPQWKVERQMMNLISPFTPFLEVYLYQYFGHLLHHMVGTRDRYWTQATKQYEYIKQIQNLTVTDFMYGKWMSY